MREIKPITPICCGKAKTTRVVKLGLYPEDTPYGEWKDIKPKWYLIGEEYFRNRRYDTKVEITRCPFCGEVLPDLELNKEIKKITEGDVEYCNTCGERNMCCDCFPPEFRWKIKK